MEQGISHHKAAFHLGRLCHNAPKAQILPRTHAANRDSKRWHDCALLYGHTRLDQSRQYRNYKLTRSPALP